MQNLYSPAIEDTTLRTEFLEIEPKFQKQEKPKPLPFYLPVIRFFAGGFSRLFPKLTAKIALRLFLTPRSKAKHRFSDKTLEAATISEILVGANILKIYEWGTGDNNVLFVHGWESRGTAGRSLVKALTDKGFKVIAFDGPAHGNSTGKRTNLVEFAEAIVAVSNRFGGIDAAITHSFGGLALTYASKNLKPKLKVKKAVMIAVPTAFDEILMKITNLGNLSEKVLEHVNGLVKNIAGETPEQLAIQNAVNETEIGELLLIHDDNDPIVDIKYAVEILKARKNAKLIRTKGLGHYRILKHSKVIAKITEFIEG